MKHKIPAKKSENAIFLPMNREILIGNIVQHWNTNSPNIFTFFLDVIQAFSLRQLHISKYQNLVLFTYFTDIIGQFPDKKKNATRAIET